jgi:hypothetical protein
VPAQEGVERRPRRPARLGLAAHVHAPPRRDAVGHVEAHAHGRGAVEAVHGTTSGAATRPAAAPGEAAAMAAIAFAVSTASARQGSGGVQSSSAPSCSSSGATGR